MLVSAPPRDNSWKVESSDAAVTYTSALRVFSADGGAVSGLFALPGENLQTLKLESSPQGFTLKDDPLRGRVKWQIKH
jgi:hypothetical protein